MELAERAFQANIQGDVATAEILLRKAFESERTAAEATAKLPNSEPTRSVLLRSAASLALDCSEYRDAEQLIAIGLAGNPPAEICEELRDLLESVYFRRHLSLRGLQLDPIEFQLTMVGDAVGFGVIESSQFLRRAETIERLLVRTAERKHHLPFREGGTPNKDVARNCQVFLSLPRAASYAITVRLGRPQRQKSLAFVEDIQPASIVEEVLGCLEDFGTGHVEELHAKIADEAYFNNFTALATKLAPDGKKVKTVGFTSKNGSKHREVALTSPPSEVWKPRIKSGATLEYVGRIVAADEAAQHGRKPHPFFHIEDGDGTRSPRIQVPVGMLQDIVKPYWGETVRVIAVETTKSHWTMIDISPPGQSEPSDEDVHETVEMK